MNFFDLIKPKQKTKTKPKQQKTKLNKVYPHVSKTPPKKTVSPDPDTPVQLVEMSLGSKSAEKSSKNTRGGKKSNKTKKLK